MNTINLDKIKSIVGEAVDSIPDSELVDAIRKLLIEPRAQQCKWDYGDPGDKYPCWIILEYPPSGTGIAYSEFGFGPKSPWGLVGLEDPGFGMDSGWYQTIEEAFSESWAAENLKIWNIIKRSTNGDEEILKASITLDEACDFTNESNKPYRDNLRNIKKHDTFHLELRMNRMHGENSLDQGAD